MPYDCVITLATNDIDVLRLCAQTSRVSRAVGPTPPRLAPLLLHSAAACERFVPSIYRVATGTVPFSFEVIRSCLLCVPVFVDA
jgi:hypothetical protein